MFRKFTRKQRQDKILPFLYFKFVLSIKIRIVRQFSARVLVVKLWSSNKRENAELKQFFFTKMSSLRDADEGGNLKKKKRRPVFKKKRKKNIVFKSTITFF